MSNSALGIFLQQLFTSGVVTIRGKTEPFEVAELEEAARLLAAAYAEDRIHQPAPVPAYDAAAALWAACYLYTALQLIANREADAAIVAGQVKRYDGRYDAAAVYSADLVLRHLPAVFHLAKGLAPNDAAVALLQQVAEQWPFSAVGIPLRETSAGQVILQHPGLRIAYADRLIQQQDLHRIRQHPELQLAVEEAMGDYTETFWPKWHLQETLPHT